MNILQSTLSSLRDHYSFVSHTSNFRSTGQISPEEFVLAGDYLVYKFPTWSWADASPESKRVSYLPPGKQYLVTRGVPCHRRLDDNFVGDAGGVADDLVQDGFLGGVDERDGGSGGGGSGGGGDGEDDGWLRTGGGSEKEQAANIREVQTMSESGNLGEKESDDEEDEIPDMEDDDDDNEAIIRDPKAGGTKVPLRTYNLYITYFPYYRTPRLYLSGYLSASEPVPPAAMMDDIVGDYKDKTVTLETFPFFDGGVKMASVHPCKHASVMKVLLDRADAALKLRLLKMRQSEAAAGGNGAGAAPPVSHTVSGMEGLIDDTANLGLMEKDKRKKKATATAHAQGVAAAGGAGGDEWEVLDQAEAEAEREGEDKSAIRVDQYLVVFLKFAASVTPTIEYDFTMGL